jgi:DNA-binding NtrC family response regulator
VAQDSTITSMSVGRLEAEPVETALPQLVMIAISDLPHEPSARHLLDAIDEVRFGRGERAATRSIVDGRRVLALRLPDRRMSSDHGRLVRGPAGWVLDDPESKNGAVVDGVVTRRIAISDGALVELGHSFFAFRCAPVERGAPVDVGDAELPGAAALHTYDGELADQFITLDRVAPTDVSLLLHGETGTGKEVVARAVHERSGRRGAFVAVNCGALPPALIEAELFGHRRGAFTGAVGERLGLVRSADGGTLFLDEVGELPVASQAAFLRVLQEREVVPVGVDRPVKVDVRLCAASWRNLEALIASGEFRRDLYARLFGLTVELPPLRRRRVDLGLLLRRVLARIPGGAEVRLAPAALRAVLRYDWPLNIRELEKSLAAAVALANDGLIEAAHLPEPVRRGPRVDDAAPAAPVARAAPAAHAPAAPAVVPRAAPHELREQLVSLLTVHEGNVVAVSRALRTRRGQVYRWLERFGLEAKAFRRRAGD